VKQSHAHITVTSRVDQGTRFSIYFPETDRRITTLRPPPLWATSGGGNETILLVEDEEPVRVMIRTLLARSGYSVLEAQNGGEAFLVCERHPADIHLLLTDVVMPRMSGHELVARIGPMRPTMRILYMSGYMGSTTGAGISDSRIDLLQKPFTPDVLTVKVREVLDGVGVPMLLPAWPD
jgi:two-component system cell cycle sensor histidine kinase/response regulator CckA